MNGPFSIGCASGSYGRSNKTNTDPMEAIDVDTNSHCSPGDQPTRRERLCVDPDGSQGRPDRDPGHQTTGPHAATPGNSVDEAAGVTVINKNSSWPLKHYMSMDPCSVTTCVEA